MALEFLDRFPFGILVGGQRVRLFHRQIDVFGTDHLVPGEDNRFPDDILQFADISRPVVELEF